MRLAGRDAAGAEGGVLMKGEYMFAKGDRSRFLKPEAEGRRFFVAKKARCTCWAGRPGAVRMTVKLAEQRANCPMHGKSKRPTRNFLCAGKRADAVGAQA